MDTIECMGNIKEVGSRYGCKMKVFTQMPSKLNKSIGDPDAIVLFTNTVSHKMALTAAKRSKTKKYTFIKMS